MTFPGLLMGDAAGESSVAGELTVEEPPKTPDDMSAGDDDWGQREDRFEFFFFAILTLRKSRKWREDGRRQSFYPTQPFQVGWLPDQVGSLDLIRWISDLLGGLQLSYGIEVVLSDDERGRGVCIESCHS